jgi:TPR repeat protein
VKRAADQGRLGAQYSYAFCLERGTGVAKDLALAAHFYKLAMDGGYKGAKAAYDRLQGSA